MTVMHFGTPWLLLLLLAFAPLAAGLATQARWRRTAAQQLVGRVAEESARQHAIRAVRVALVLTALTLLVFAAARPQRGSRELPLPREGSEVMVVLDASLSMLAADVVPSRFERAKAVVSDALDLMHGDRVGLVVYAGNAKVRFPFTTDLAAAQALVRSTAIKEGGLAPSTAIGEAIRVAVDAFPPDDQTQSKVLLLVSDGEDLAGSPLDAVRLARARGVVIYTVGVGTETATPIFLPRPDGRPQPLIDPTTGAQALTRRETGLLRELARAGNGRSFEGNDDEAASAVAREIGRLTLTRFESQAGALPIERFQAIAAVALLLTVVSILLPQQGWRRSSSTAASPRPPTEHRPGTPADSAPGRAGTAVARKVP
jgi:Ca-activated chloride channel family protein